MSSQTNADANIKPPLLPVVVAAAICGAMAIIGLAFSIYTYLHSPEINEVPIFVDGQFRRTEDKLTYLFVMPGFNFFMFLMTAYTLVRWKKHSRRVSDRQAKYIASGDLLGGINLKSLSWATSAAICFCCGTLLFQAISRCISILGQ